MDGMRRGKMRRRKIKRWNMIRRILKRNRRSDGGRVEIRRRTSKSRRKKRRKTRRKRGRKGSEGRGATGKAT